MFSHFITVKLIELKIICLMYLYSYDAREGESFSDGHRWADENVLGRRAYFLPTRSAGRSSTYTRHKRSMQEYSDLNKEPSNTPTTWGLLHLASNYHSPVRKRKKISFNSSNEILFKFERTKRLPNNNYNTEWEGRGESDRTLNNLILFFKHEPVLQWDQVLNINNKKSITHATKTDRRWHVEQSDGIFPVSLPSLQQLYNPSIVTGLQGYGVNPKNGHRKKHGNNPWTNPEDDPVRAWSSRTARETSEFEPALSLVPVAQEDHGLYRCRMDYWESPTSMSYTSLYVASEY